MISLKNQNAPDQTSIPNLFIDRYMPHANGEFVKVYLLLARLLSSSEDFCSLEALADYLQCTEKDLMRALTYWDSKGLLSLSFDVNQKVDSITLLSVTADPVQGEALTKTVSPRDLTAPQSEEISGTDTVDKSIFSTSPITADRVRELTQDPAVRQILFVAQQYFGRPISQTESQTLLYLYDEVHMSADLIEYLIEYCVSRDSKSMHYLQTVALRWAADGITTVQMARDSVSAYRKDYYQILKALGIRNRDPISDEVQIMDTWMKDYGFDLSIILEACRRTVMSTHQGSFQYTDKILAAWKSKGVHTLADIEQLDVAHQKQKQTRKAQPETGRSRSGNRFNNFQQRKYDFDQMERALLDQTSTPRN